MSSPFIPATKERATWDDPEVRVCTIGGVDHDWRLHVYQPYISSDVHRSWRCVWCHALACGDYDETDPCMEPYHHPTPHLSASGVIWAKGGTRP